MLTNDIARAEIERALIAAGHSLARAQDIVAAAAGGGIGPFVAANLFDRALAEDIGARERLYLVTDEDVRVAAVRSWRIAAIFVAARPKDGT